MATIGGVYENKGDVEIGIRVDNSLCDGYTFESTGGDVEIVRELTSDLKCVC